MKNVVDGRTLSNTQVVVKPNEAWVYPVDAHRVWPANHWKEMLTQCIHEETNVGGWHHLFTVKQGLPPTTNTKANKEMPTRLGAKQSQYFNQCKQKHEHNRRNVE